MKEGKRGITTISISQETKEMLRKKGEKGMSFEDIILELLEEVD